MITPTVLVGKPDNVESFKKIEVDEITLYFHTGVKANSKIIEVDLQGFLFLKNLVVSGLEC